MGLLNLGKDNWARTNPTKEGIIFLSLSLFVGFAAINTGNNLLYLAFGIMMSVIIASGVMSMINLSRIEVRTNSPGEIFAASPSKLKFILANKKPLVPTYSISIELNGERVHIPYLSAGEAKAVYINYRFEIRGWNDIPEARLSTRFPFGFFKKWIKIDTGNRKVLVYPKLRNIKLDTEDIQKKTDRTISSLSGEAVTRRGLGEDVRSVKEYNSGDNPKLIHWKTSAKRGSVMVREMEEETHNNEAVLKFLPGRDRVKIEPEISRVASTFLELKKRGFEVEFHSPDRVFSSTQTTRSPASVLAYLALFNN